MTRKNVLAHFKEGQAQKSNIK